MKHWIKQILIAVDQMANTLFGGLLFGNIGDTWADETISARAYRTRSRFEPLINLLFFCQENHCEACYEWEWARLDLPPEYRTMANTPADADYRKNFGGKVPDMMEDNTGELPSMYGRLSMEEVERLLGTSNEKPVPDDIERIKAVAAADDDKILSREDLDKLFRDY
ncbi:MAG: hypothetical protein LBT46_15445 [Planctomycetaceae bacterium]|jgi:hypothetical protein|nr:hypothetical protein [Planctomycetaceae bacterium]